MPRGGGRARGATRARGSGRGRGRGVLRPAAPVGANVPEVARSGEGTQPGADPGEPSSRSDHESNARAERARRWAERAPPPPPQRRTRPRLEADSATAPPGANPSVRSQDEEVHPQTGQYGEEQGGTVTVQVSGAAGDIGE